MEAGEKPAFRESIIKGPAGLGKAIKNIPEL
jgi:hypothetical protein